MAGAVITYGATILSPGTDLVITPVGGGNPMTAEYGDYNSGRRSSTTTIPIQYTNITETLDGNGTLTLDMDVTFGAITRVHEPGAPTNTPYRHIIVRLLDETVLDTRINTTPTGVTLAQQTRHITVVVPSGQTVHTGGIYYYNSAELGYPPDEFYLGVIINNPNPPDYRPMSVMVDGVSRSCNRSDGMMGVMVDGNFVECRTYNGGVGEDNPPAIMIDGVAKNQNLVGEQ